MTNNTVASNITGSEITYAIEGEDYTGYYAYDDNIKEKRPAVIIVHDIWGYGDYVKRRAEQLASCGYAAFALDMYGIGKASEDPPTAQAQMAILTENTKLIKTRFSAAQSVLTTQAQVDSTKIAAIGYCFGGYVVLRMARLGVPLAAVVSFHGLLKTDTPLKKGVFEGAIGVFNGEADPMVPPKDVDSFTQEMVDAGANYSIKNYPSVLHGFTNPLSTARGKKTGSPVDYDVNADTDSWQGMLDIFNRTF